MTGTSTAKALWEAASKCVPTDTQVWTLENSTVGFTNNGSFSDVAAGLNATLTYTPGAIPTVPTPGGIPVTCCTTLNTTTTECNPETLQSPTNFATNGTNPATSINVTNNPLICGTILCNAQFTTPLTVTPAGVTTTNVIVDSQYVAFRNFTSNKRCWTPHTIADIGSTQPPSTIPPQTGSAVARPCRVYLTAGSWTPTAVSSVATTAAGSVIVGNPSFPSTLPVPTVTPFAITASAVKVELLTGLDAIIDSFVSCANLCSTPTTPITTGQIPDLLVDTSVLVYAFNKGDYCDNYFDSDGNPISSAAQFINALLAGEDLEFACTQPNNSGACGCLCSNDTSKTINLCDFHCLASRLICTEKLKWVLDTYLSCHRPRTLCCGFCDFGTV